MSPVISAATATLAGILSTISSLPGGYNGPTVTDLNNQSVNILPSLTGPNDVGVANISFFDFSRHGFPLCDVGDEVMPDANCHRPREIRTSVFYPACLPLGDQEKPLLLDERHFSPVFPASVLAKLSRNISSGPGALHNLMSQAIGNAASCEGQFPIMIFAPTAGGQRQAYTQAASELASLGNVVVAVDYPFLSGAVDSQLDKAVLAGMFGDWIHTDEALSTQARDLYFVLSHLVVEERPLSKLRFWAHNTTIQPGACVFGHGTGGQVAQMMVDTHAVECGGALEGILALPAPFNTQESAADSPSAVTQTRTSVPPSPGYGTPKHSAPNLSPVTQSRLIQSLKRLEESSLNIIGMIFCSLQGNCGVHYTSKSLSFQKRRVDDDPWYDSKDPYYDDDKYEHDDHYYDGYDDHYEDGYHDHHDHYHDDYDYPDIPYHPYHPIDRYKRPYRPSRPFPPPGIFPPNFTWPPYGGNIPGYGRPGHGNWDNYHNGGGYGGNHGHKDYDYYNGGYKHGYGDDYYGDHDCDHYPGHYPDHYPDYDHGDYGHVDDWDKQERA